MDNNKLRPASELCIEILNEYLRNLKWHQRLKLQLRIKLEDIWAKILINTVYRKYKDKRRI